MFFLRKLVASEPKKYVRKKSDASYNNAIHLLNSLLSGNLQIQGISKKSSADFSISVQEQFANQRDHLLPILVDIILQGKTTNPVFSRQASSRIATNNTRINSYIPSADLHFVVFCVRYSNCINDFLNGDISVETFQKTIERLKTHAEENSNNYYRFLVINFIDSYALNQKALNYETLNYYQSLFNAVENFQQKDTAISAELFLKNLPVPKSRVLRLNNNLRPFRINTEFDQLNTYNLSLLTSELTAEQAEKFLNYICHLAKLPRAKGKDLVFFYADNTDPAYLPYLKKSLVHQLNSYNDSDFLNLNKQTFLGYRFYFNDHENSLEIILDNSINK